MAGELRVLAQQLRQLTGQHRRPDADLDPEQRRPVDDLDQGSEPEQPRDQEDDADQESEGQQVARDVGRGGDDAGGDQRGRRRGWLMVDVVDTLMAREPPIAAYTSMGTTQV